jgi:hypothetical protein
LCNLAALDADRGHYDKAGTMLERAVHTRTKASCRAPSGCPESYQPGGNLQGAKPLLGGRTAFEASAAYREAMRGKHFR